MKPIKYFPNVGRLGKLIFSELGFTYGYQCHAKKNHPAHDELQIIILQCIKQNLKSWALS